MATLRETIYLQFRIPEFGLFRVPHSAFKGSGFAMSQTLQEQFRSDPQTCRATGVAGFIGSSIVEQWLRNQHRRSATRSQNPRAALVGPVPGQELDSSGAPGESVGPGCNR
jgi:hypothetical protein